MSLATFQLPTPSVTRAIFAQYPSGVAALAAKVTDKSHILVASSLTVGVSLEPPLVTFAVQNTSSTWPLLRRAENIGVSILAHDQGELCRRLASKDVSVRLAEVPYRNVGSAIYIEGSSSYMDCTLFAEHSAGDHTIVVLKVEGITDDPDRHPLVFHASGFTRLAPGTSMKS